MNKQFKIFMLFIAAILCARSGHAKNSFLTVHDIMMFTQESETESGFSDFLPYKDINRSLSKLGAKSVAVPWTMYIYEGFDLEGPEFSAVKGTRVVYLLKNAQITYTYGNYCGREARQLSLEFDNEDALNKFIDSAVNGGFFNPPSPDEEDSFNFETIYTGNAVGFDIHVSGLQVFFVPNVG